MNKELIELCDALDDKVITEQEFHEAMIALREKRDEQYRQEKLNETDKK
jgi:hypothetical protein